MQSRFFWLTSCYILTATIVRQDVVDSLDTDEPNLFTLHDDDTSSSSLYINPDFGTADDDLWSSDTTNLIDADNTGLFLDDDNDDIIASCSSSGNTDTLTRRADDGKTCTSPQKPEDETPPDVKFRPLRTTKDLPISIPTYNLEICDALTMGIFRTIVACDSGREEDRKTTTDAGVYVLQHCTPCMWMLGSSFLEFSFCFCFCFCFCFIFWKRKGNKQNRLC